MRRLVLISLAVAIFASCSFTTATGFKECTADAQCGSSNVCVKEYCLPLPANCRREEGVFDKADRIPIAALLPLSTDGVTDDSELQGLAAMRLAMGEANAQGGIKNRKFGLFVCDTARKEATLQAQEAWFVSNLNPPAIITSGSSQTRAAADEPSRVDAGTMIIAATSTSSSLSAVYQRDQNVWRIAPPDSQQAKVLARLVRDTLAAPSMSTIAVVHEAGQYGDDFAIPLANELTDLSFSVRRIPYETTTSATTTVNQLDNAAPVATVIIGFPKEVKDILSVAHTRTRLQRANGHRWFLADASKDPNVIVTDTRDELEGCLGTAPAQGAGPAFREFRQSFITRYGIDPNTYSFTSHSYDAMWLVQLSAAWASQNSGGITGPRMREGMARVSTPGAPPMVLLANKWLEASGKMSAGLEINVEGSSGLLDFDLQTGTPSSPYEVWQISDGGINTLRLVNP